MKTSVLQRGQGKDLVFLHGYGANKECFLHQINYFSKFYKVTAFDFWGFGQSEGLPSAWDVEAYAKQTSALLKELKIQDAYVIAHSFGARVAVKLQSKEKPFKKMVLTGAAGVILGHGMGYKLKVLAYRAVKKLFPTFAEKRFGSEEYKKLSPLMKESFKKIVNEDLRFDARKIDVPVLLVYGESDKTTTVKEGMEYCLNIPNSELCVMPNCGHFAFLDDEINFKRIVEEFLEKS